MEESTMRPIESLKSIFEEIDSIQRESNELGFSILNAIKCSPDTQKAPEEPPVKCMFDSINAVREKSIRIRNQLLSIQQLLLG